MALFLIYNSAMTYAELAKKIKTLKAELAELDGTIREVATSGYASASLSAGAGSKSYTRADLASLRAYRAELAGRIASLMRRASGSVMGISHVVTVRD